MYRSTEAKEAVWESSNDIRVQDMLWGDINHDDDDELVLLCWKKGRYGISKPFWEEDDTDRWSQHIYIYEWRGGELRPFWMASDIGILAKEFSYREPYMYVREYSRKESCWIWRTRGLELCRPSFTLCAVGDNLIHNPIYDYAFANTDGNFDFMYEHVVDAIDKYDISVINQETIFVPDRGMYSTFPSFGTPLGVGEAIEKAGFTVATCATNHALDKGMTGIDTTVAFYENKGGTVCVGIQDSEHDEYEPYKIIECKGLKIAFLNYTYGTNGVLLPSKHPYAVHLLKDESLIRESIGAARKEADVVIVCAHWGTEYRHEPDSLQQKWTKIFADCNVDLVIGCHPHVLQPVESIERADGGEMVVYYSLGNFVSDQKESERMFGGMASVRIGHLEGGGYGVSSHELIPLITHIEHGMSTSYFLEDYSDELAARHKLDVSMWRERLE